MPAPHTQQFQQALNSVTTVDLASGSTKLLGGYPISPDEGSPMTRIATPQAWSQIKSRASRFSRTTLNRIA